MTLLVDKAFPRAMTLIEIQFGFRVASIYLLYKNISIDTNNISFDVADCPESIVISTSIEDSWTSFPGVTLLTPRDVNQPSPSDLDILILEDIRPFHKDGAAKIVGNNWGDFKRLCST